MTNDQPMDEERYVDVRIFGIPEKDWFEFKEIIELYGGERVKAFQALKEAFYKENTMGEITTRLQRLEQRIEDMENQKKEEVRHFPKTFG